MPALLVSYPSVTAQSSLCLIQRRPPGEKAHCSRSTETSKIRDFHWRFNIQALFSVSYLISCRYTVIPCAPFTPFPSSRSTQRSTTAPSPRLIPQSLAAMKTHCTSDTKGFRLFFWFFSLFFLPVLLFLCHRST